MIEEGAMGKYVLTKQFEGERPFRCPRCNKLVAVDVQGEFKLVVVCVRCRARLTLEVGEALPPALAMKSGILVNQ